MSNPRGEEKQYDILPPPLEKITRGTKPEKVPLTTQDKVVSYNEWNREDEKKNEGTTSLKKETNAACLVKQDTLLSQNKIKETLHIEKESGFHTDESSSNDGKRYDNYYYEVTNNSPHNGVMGLAESPQIKENGHNRSTETSEFNIASVYEDLILNREEIDAVIEENEEFRNMLDNETITNFMDECVKDPLKTFEKYKTNKDVLKFIQLLLDFMCAKYSYLQANNLPKNFTFEKKN